MKRHDASQCTTCAKNGLVDPCSRSRSLPVKGQADVFYALDTSTAEISEFCSVAYVTGYVIGYVAWSYGAV